MNRYHRRHLGRRPMLLPFAVPWASEAGAAGLSGAQAGTAMALVIAVAVVLMAGLALHREQRRREVVEEALAASKIQQQALIDTMVDAVIIIDDMGRIQNFNPAAEAMFGHAASKVIGQNIRLLMPEPHHSAHDGYLARHKETGVRCVLGRRSEVEALRRDGSRFPVELAVTAMKIHGRRLFSGLLRDITERRKVERLKDEFIATISHELRTPLTAIRGSLGLINGGVVGELPAQSAALIRLAHDNSERLLLLVDDLLDVERLGSGRMEFHFVSLALMPLIEEAIAKNAAVAEKHAVQCVIVRHLDGASVHGDPQRLLQVLGNLLSNACKFSPRDSTVEIDVMHREDRVRIDIRDYGPGIAEELRPRLFSRFAQGDTGNTRQSGGTGLGLCISKAIVERHGGEIGFVPGAEVGTTFYLELAALGSMPSPNAIDQGRKE
ncbi:MAG TPA: PAS domain S-box protein [Chromatiales bacterium]|nr:PAS domain S-box protein [Chromatiales bacterium]HEX22604.1 PAS domain S-box protein [Chromatiales bacterium]